jgi:hypothetical protein
MLLQVGRVVVELSNVDHVLGFIYGMLGEGPPDDRWRAYSSLRGFQKRLEAVNRAVSQRVKLEQSELWRAAYGKLKEGRIFRNQVAHFGMRRMFTSDSRNLGVELRPPWYLPNSAEEALKITGVKHAADQLVDAKADLWDFINSVAR